MKVTEVRVYAIWFGAVLFGSMAWAFSGERGKLDAAFREAWRDSFGTDVTDEIAKALPSRDEDVVALARASDFTCDRNSLVEGRVVWLCSRFAWGFFDPPFLKRERWVFEVECKETRPPCEVARYRGHAANAPLFNPHN